MIMITPTNILIIDNKCFSYNVDIPATNKHIAIVNLNFFIFNAYLTYFDIKVFKIKLENILPKISISFLAKNYFKYPNSRCKN